LLLLVALGCAGSTEEPSVDLEAERQALMDADQAWFESYENVDEFMTFVAAEATFMPAGSPADGAESFRTWWEQVHSIPGFNLVWQTTSAEVAEAGDIGYTLGTYELNMEQDGTAMVTVGKYVTIWKKQADGSWKVVVDCFNADGPPTEA
jgi:ketosteroid isomerase-like protein